MWVASKQFSPKHLSPVEQESHVVETDNSNACRTRCMSLVLGVRVSQRKMDQLGNVPWSHTKEWRVHYTGKFDERSLAVTIPKWDNCECSLPQWEKSMIHHSTKCSKATCHIFYPCKKLKSKVCVTWQKLVINVKFVRITFHIVLSPFRTVGHEMFSSRDTARALLEDRTLRPAFSAMAAVTS